MRLARKVAIVTGAAREIGLAIAQRFVREGATVALADRLAAEAEAEAKEIASAAVSLASDEAPYATGTTIYADGGRLALNGLMARRR